MLYYTKTVPTQFYKLKYIRCFNDKNLKFITKEMLLQREQIWFYIRKKGRMTKKKNKMKYTVDNFFKRSTKAYIN